jgi:hypothetical protein
LGFHFVSRERSAGAPFNSTADKMENGIELVGSFRICRPHFLRANQLKVRRKQSLDFRQPARWLTNHVCIVMVKRLPARDQTSKFLTVIFFSPSISNRFKNGLGKSGRI